MNLKTKKKEKNRMVDMTQGWNCALMTTLNWVEGPQPGQVRGRAMHIVVCVKQVPDTTNVRINPETNTLMRMEIDVENIRDSEVKPISMKIELQDAILNPEEIAS